MSQKERLVRYNSLTKRREIDLTEIIYKLWLEKMFILKTTTMVALIGLLHVFTAPVVYRTELILLPEASEENSIGALSGLAGLAGINLGGLTGSDDLDPELFPKIIYNPEFLDSLLSYNVYHSALNDTLSVEDFLLEHSSSSILGYLLYVKALPSLLKEFILGNESDNSVMTYSLKYYSKEKLELMEVLENQIEIEVDRTLGTVKIAYKYQDPVACAYINQFIFSYLKNYIIEYRTAKERENLYFVEDQLNKAKSRFYQKQEELALYEDRNKNVSNAYTRTNEERLRSEFNLAFNVYNNLAQQYETSQISVQNRAPVFSILNEVSIPSEKSEPKRKLIFMIFIFFGVLLGAIIVIFRSYSWSIKN